MVEEEEEEEEEDDDDEEEEDGGTTGAVSPVPEGRRRFISLKRKNVIFSYYCMILFKILCRPLFMIKPLYGILFSLRILPLLISLYLLCVDPPRPSGLSALFRRPPRHQAGSFRLRHSGAGAVNATHAPCLVWTHIYGGPTLSSSAGSINFQYYLLESVRQARIWNPGVPFFILTDDSQLLFRERPHWATLLAQGHLNASVVDVATLRDWELIHIETRMRDIWGPLAHNIGTSMMPSLAGGTNFAFTTVTLTRLLYLHHWLRQRGGGQAVHLENDQMLYGHVLEVAAPARACGVQMALGRVAQDRYAAAVLYLDSHTPLRQLLDFLTGALSHGWQHAAAVARSYWVTDMSLTAAFVEQQQSGGSSAVTTFPAPEHAAAQRQQGQCLASSMGVLVDAAVLGIWCCGDMGRGRQWMSVRTEFAEGSALFEAPFEWRSSAVVQQQGAAEAGLGRVQWGGEVRVPRREGGSPSRAEAEGQWLSVGGGEEGQGQGAEALRYPTWNGTRLFNLHLSSKMLHWWRSDHAQPPLEEPEFAGETGDMG